MWCNTTYKCCTSVSSSCEMEHNIDNMVKNSKFSMETDSKYLILSAFPCGIILLRCDQITTDQFSSTSLQTSRETLHVVVILGHCISVSSPCEMQHNVGHRDEILRITEHPWKIPCFVFIQEFFINDIKIITKKDQTNTDDTSI